jgi:hypothetical protein
LEPSVITVTGEQRSLLYTSTTSPKGNFVVSKINVNKIATRMERVSTFEDSEQWMDQKSIDDKSLDNYLDTLATQGLKEILGELSYSNDRQAAVKHIYDLIGTAFQLGYTTCEAQIERNFLSEEKDGD